ISGCGVVVVDAFVDGLMDHGNGFPHPALRPQHAFAAEAKDSHVFACSAQGTFGNVCGTGHRFFLASLSNGFSAILCCVSPISQQVACPPLSPSGSSASEASRPLREVMLQKKSRGRETPASAR